MGDGSIYKGQWLNGLRDGYGEIFYNDGSVYEGEWRNDKANGKGKMTNAHSNALAHFYQQYHCASKAIKVKSYLLQ